MARLVSSTIFILASLFLAVNSLGSIPALLWSPEGSDHQYSPDLGANIVKSDDFLNRLLIPLMDKPSGCGVVFLQDKLHVDDFTRFADVYSPDSDGGSFKNIRNLVDKHYSLELPQVADPYNAIVKLKSSFSGDVHSVQSVEDLKGLNLSNDKKTLLIVNLSPVSTHNDVENALQQNDATIGNIAEHLEKRNIKYNALFTGQEASKDQVSAVESHSNRRLLETEPSNNGTFMNVSGQIYAFMREATLLVRFEGKQIANMNLTLNESTANESSFSNSSALIVYTFNDTKYNDSSYNVRIETLAVNRKDRWVMTRVSLYIEGGKVSSNNNISLENATLSAGDMDFTIPMIYSWHCTDMFMYVDHIHDENATSFKGTYIRLRGYQLQPFSIQKNRFFDAQDCVPYFTTAIWMFLFSSIFLIAILIFGVLMVLSLSTMDKYDDPKGKTITVAQGTD